jgi:hypothetical protein
MGGSVPFGFGVRFLYDSHLRYWRPGLPIALRIRNYTTPEVGYAELGFQYSPSGTAQYQAGFTDIIIKPPAEVKELSLMNIGLNSAKLMFGAKQFVISHTFVRAQMNANNYTDPYQVFRNPLVVGIAYPAYPLDAVRLFSIESITHEEIAGQTLAWTLLCNAAETAVSVQGET